MSTDFLGITWAALHYLVWFPLFFVSLGILLYRFRRIQFVRTLLAGTQLQLLFHHFSLKRQRIKLLLMSIGLFFLFLTLLHPQWNKVKEKAHQEGREVFIALDISRSMLATDCMPNRLHCARQKIRELLQLLSCERVGLILFSGSAFVQCPLTDDYAAFDMFLDQVDAELISSGTTALDKAIQQALQSFQSMPNRKNKLLILFTDGEDFSSNLVGIKKEAQKEKLCIFTVGVGTVQGAPVPLFDRQGRQVGHQKNRKGNVVISRLNEGILHSLSESVGGKYLLMTKDNEDVTTLVQYVQSYEKEQLEDKTFSRMEQQYPYFLLVSLLCFSLEWLL